MIKYEAKILINQNIEDVWQYLNLNKESNIHIVDQNFLTFSCKEKTKDYINSFYDATYQDDNQVLTIEVEIMDYIDNPKYKKIYYYFDQDEDFGVNTTYELEKMSNDLTEVKLIKIIKDLTGFEIDVPYVAIEKGNMDLLKQLERFKTKINDQKH